MKIITEPGRVYAVASANGATITNANGLVLLDVGAGAQGCFVAPGAYVECSDEAASVTAALTGGGVSGSGGGGGGGSAGAGKSAYELAQEAGFAGSVSEWLESLKGEPGEQGAPGERGEKGEPGGVDPEELEAAVDKALSMPGESIVLGEGADDNLNARSIELSEVHAPAGFEVAEVRLLARSGQSVSGEAVYLSAWEQVSGEDYRLIGVSTNAQAQVLEEWTEWHFEGLVLGGKRVRWAALAAPDTPFGEASELFLRVKAREGDDSCVIHTSSAPFNYHPAMVIKSVARDRFAPMSHVGDSSHITAEEREKWDGAADKAEKAKQAVDDLGTIADNAAELAKLAEHSEELLGLSDGVSNAEQQAAAAQNAATAAQNAADAAKTDAQRALDNAKLANDNLSKEKNEALQHLYWHHSGNNAALAALMGDNGAAYFPEAKHVTAEEKSRWDGAATDATQAQSAASSALDTAREAKSGADGLRTEVLDVKNALTEHKNDTTGHITAAERVKWNNAAESGGGFEDTGYVTGGTATDTFSVAVGGRSNSQSYSVVVGAGASAMGAFSTAIGTGAHADYKGSFALGFNAEVDNVGEGVMRVATDDSRSSDATVTKLKLVGAGSEVSNEQLDGACGLGYKEKTADWRYAKLKDIFDLADKAEDILSFGGDHDHAGGGLMSTQIGRNAQATGQNSVAIGCDALASGLMSMAIGFGAQATGNYAIAIGRDARANSGEIVLKIKSAAASEGSLEVKFLSPTSDLAKANLGGRAGFCYRENDQDYRYVSLENLWLMVMEYGMSQ